MRSPHTLTITREDGTTHTVHGYAEVVGGTRIDTTGHHDEPRIEAIITQNSDVAGFGTVWTCEEGDKLTAPHGITGLITQVRPVMSARTGSLLTVEVSAG